MVRHWPLDLGDLLDGGVLEPRKLLERQQQLLVAKQEPEPVLGNMRDFSCRSDGSMHFEFPRYALPLPSTLMSTGGLPVLELLCKGTKCERFRFGHRLVGGCSIGEHPRQLRDLCQPATIGFALDL